MSCLRNAREENWPVINVGIGVHSGCAVVGSMGSSRHHGVYGHWRDSKHRALSRICYQAIRREYSRSASIPTTLSAGSST